MAFYSRGQNAYRNRNYTEAVNCFSKSLSDREDVEPHVLYSNRCASYLQLNNPTSALRDAERCVQLAPCWTRGYSRLGKCYFALANFEASRGAYEKVLRLEPGNVDARAALEQIRSIENNRGATSSSSSQSQSNSRSAAPSAGIGGNIMASLTGLFEQAKNYVIRTISSLSTGQVTISTNTILIGVIVLLLLYIWLCRRSYGYDSYGGGYDYDYGFGYGGYSTGLSWTQWALILFAAYKVPPMFPEQLGHQYARPFFGMNWTTFIWLLSMVNNNFLKGRRGGGGFRGGFPRRGY
jgi:tetratricopeptide (TPR) repeat protein